MPNVKLKKFAAYHGVRNMKFAPKKADGTYDSENIIELLYAQSINPSAVLEDAEQFADDRMVCRIPSDQGYDLTVGTTSQDPALEEAAGFLIAGAAGAVTTDVTSYLRGALYYEFTAHGEDGRAVRVKTWMFNTELGKGSETHATDKKSLEFGAYEYPGHCYGDPLMAADGTTRYVDDNGMERTAYMVRAVPGDEGYDTFGAAVPLPKVAAAGAAG